MPSLEDIHLSYQVKQILEEFRKKNTKPPKLDLITKNMEPDEKDLLEKLLKFIN